MCPPQVDGFKATLQDEEQKLGADIIRKALSYPLRLIASNAGVNGSVVIQKVLDNAANPSYGYNAATDKFEDLMESGIIDPTKVRRGAHALGGLLMVGRLLGGLALESSSVPPEIKVLWMFMLGGQRPVH